MKRVLRLSFVAAALGVIGFASCADALPKQFPISVPLTCRKSFAAVVGGFLDSTTFMVPASTASAGNDTLITVIDFPALGLKWNHDGVAHAPARLVITVPASIAANDSMTMYIETSVDPSGTWPAMGKWMRTLPFVGQLGVAGTLQWSLPITGDSDGVGTGEPWGARYMRFIIRGKVTTSIGGCQAWLIWDDGADVK